MRAVLLVATTSLWFAVSAESCIAGPDNDCEDGPLPTWEEKVEWCIAKGRTVPFLSDRSHYVVDKLTDVQFDSRFLPSEVQESPQRVGDELCPDRSQFFSRVIKIYCEGSLQYETATGSSLPCVVKLRKENKDNSGCFPRVEMKSTWECKNNTVFSCVPCTSPDAINSTITPQIKLDLMQITPIQGLEKKLVLQVKVTGGDILMDKSVFCYFIDPHMTHGLDFYSAKVYHFKGSAYIIPLFGSDFYTPSKNNTDMNVWCEGVDISTGRVVRSRICQQINNDGCLKWVDDRKVNESLEILANNITNATAMQNATDMVHSSEINEQVNESLEILANNITNATAMQNATDMVHSSEINEQAYTVNKSLEILATKSRNITNAPAMENALDVVLRYALDSSSVARALQDFETFTANVFLGDERELKLNNSSLFSTLVLASAAGISASNSSMTSLTRGSDAVAISGDVDVSVAVVLPSHSGDRRVSLTIFTEEAEQVFKQEGYTINSLVVSVTVEGVVDYLDVVLQRRTTDKFGKCANWNLTSKRWDTTYCEKLVIGEVSDVCRCSHPTHFGQILVDGDVQWELIHSIVLNAISMVGCSLSLLGASGVAATAALSNEWRRRPSTKVLLQLVGAVALRDATFVAVAVNVIPSKWCSWAGVALHYAVLAACMWSVAAAVLQALRLGTIAGVASVPHVVMVCALCAWLVPLLPVGLLLAVKGLGAFAKRGDETRLCFPRDFCFYATVAIPAGLAVLVNSCVFLYLTYVIFQCSSDGRRIRKSSDGSTMLRRKLLTCALLFFLFGLTWVFGFPARSFVVACIFCAVATPQGFVLFLFFVFGDEQARKKWFSALSCNKNSSRASKKTVSNLALMKRYNIAPLPKRDQATFKSYEATTEGNDGERTYHFSGSPPRGEVREIARSNDYDLPDSTQIDSGSGMHNLPPTLKNDQSTVVLKSYVKVKEFKEE